MDLPRVNAPSQKRLTEQEEHTALAKAADLHTISRITQIWSDRLQLISVYASFFTSIDSVLFSLASNKGNGSTTSKLMHASLTGALIFHAATAILAYVASFVLIRYKLNDAESIPGGSNSKSAIANVYAKYGPTPVDEKGKVSVLVAESGRVRAEHGHVRAEHGHHFPSLLSSPVIPFLSTLSTAFSSLLDQPPLLNIDIRRVSLFDIGAVVPCVGEPVHDGDSHADAEKNAIALGRLLNRCHSVCSLFALAGFLLLVTGIITYVWEVLEESVAIFASACVGVCIAFGLVALH
ncbi:hypothetical protein EDB83DRAFT_2399490 [Lactarius deliciosus]|nr:hypothetical protein EDB83DRAFT_2399490 [Lactarius deliciosus]